MASSQQLLSSYASDEELFRRRFVTGNKLWIYLSKLEFIQWKDVDCPTLTSMCNSSINWLGYGNSFFLGYREIAYDRLYLHPGKTTTGTAGQYYAEPTFKLLDVMKQKH